jgi:hypothetical protein
MGEGPVPLSSWQEPTKSECFELLAGQRIGRVAVVDDRGPIALPVNFILDRHMVVFRTEEGTKLDAASRGSRVGFEVDGTDAATRTGWSERDYARFGERLEQCAWRNSDSCWPGPASGPARSPWAPSLSCS